MMRSMKPAAGRATGSRRASNAIPARFFSCVPAVIWGAKASLRWRLPEKENVLGEHPQPGKPGKDLYHFTESDFWLSACHVSFLRKPPVSICAEHRLSAAAPLLVPQGDNRVHF